MPSFVWKGRGRGGQSQEGVLVADSREAAVATLRRQQVRVTFETKDEAVAYARKHGFTYTVREPRERRIKPKAYADNFAYTRREPWTH